MIFSVVIPTYNRGPKLAATLDAVLGSLSDGLDQVEIVVVDDGSPDPAQPVIQGRTVRPPFTLRCLRQANAGPAAARNTGFRNTAGDIVLFMDDDILVPSGLLLQHVKAHESHPGAVIFGACPLVKGDPPNPLFRYLDEVLDDSIRSSGEAFVRQTVVSSGQISVERSCFRERGAVYRDDLATPAAEEYELSFRLRKMGIPVFFAPHIVARHDHPVAIASICLQQYKHALGCAEVASRAPEVLELVELCRVFDAYSRGSILRQTIKRLGSSGVVSRTFLWLAQSAERLTARPAFLWPLYSAAIRTYWYGGIRQGLARYAPGHGCGKNAATAANPVVAESK